jgi:hypothetical protein
MKTKKIRARKKAKKIKHHPPIMTTEDAAALGGSATIVSPTIEKKHVRHVKTLDEKFDEARAILPTQKRKVSGDEEKIRFIAFVKSRA